MRLYSLIVLSLTALAVSACGPRPLTEEQKRILRETQASYQKTHQVVERHQPQTERSTRLSTLSGFDPWEIDDESDDASTPVLDPNDAFFQRLTRCEPRTTALARSGARVRLEGSACPIRLEISATSEGTEESGRSQVDVLYEVTDESFRSLNDIDRVDFKAETKHQNPNPRASGDVQVRLEMNINGSIRSQKYGVVKLSAQSNIENRFSTSSRSLPQMTGNLTARLEFSDFVAEGRVELKGSEEPVFSINGETVTAQEFAELMGETQGSATSGVSRRPSRRSRL